MNRGPVSFDATEFVEAQMGIYVDLAMILHRAGIIDARELVKRLDDQDNPVVRITPASREMAGWASRKLTISLDYADAKQALYGGDGETVGSPRLTLVRPDE